MTKNELLSLSLILIVGVVAIYSAIILNQPSITIKQVGDNGTIWVEFRGLEATLMENNTYYLYINDNGTKLFIKDGNK